MADISKVLLEGKTTPFRIDLQGIQTSIKGIVMNNINYGIVAGMDWFTQVNLSVCWKTKVMTIKHNGVNFNILKEPNTLILRDTPELVAPLNEYTHNYPPNKRSNMALIYASVATNIPSLPANISHKTQAVSNELPHDVSNDMDQSDGNFKLRALSPN
ncbi:hypothetical protein DSO57_1009267 [Entomophthora muscae]|uniref:Uncharacterized protein n=1 Tax=Entomophthora muscae TaxID=34485 RepID=A0ACC2UGT3_9FUNG|nr:hypothetical protein DSO57_1009267 [Entomophthora muscae]